MHDTAIAPVLETPPDHEHLWLSVVCCAVSGHYNPLLDSSAPLPMSSHL